MRIGLLLLPRLRMGLLLLRGRQFMGLHNPWMGRYSYWMGMESLSPSWRMGTRRILFRFPVLQMARLLLILGSSLRHFLDTIRDSAYCILNYRLHLLLLADL